MAEQDPTATEQPKMTIELAINPATFKEQLNDIMQEATQAAALKLISAAYELNPEWMDQRDKAVGQAAVAAYKAENGIS